MDNIAALILSPIIWGSLAFLLPSTVRSKVAIVGLATGCLWAIGLALAITEKGAFYYYPGDWGAPLGIALKADGLAATMVLLTQLVSLIAGLYAQLYLRNPSRQASAFWPLLGFLISGLNALFLSADFFNLYVTLEVVGLAAVSLVAINSGIGQLKAALRYLIATLIGSGFYLLAVALIYGLYGTVAFSDIATLTHNHAPSAETFLTIAFGLMILGLLIKAALWPLHYWLPPAHGGAMPAVSALLSALVVKAAFYIVLRLWLVVFGTFADLWIPVMYSLGAGAILVGSWKAARTDQIKHLVAYSTVAQMGYLFLALPLLKTVAATTAMQAISIQMVAHGLAKAAMFMAAGVLVLASKSSLIADLRGSASRQPLAVFAFAVAGISLIGLPPSGGFVAKWFLLIASFNAGLWPISLVVLTGGLLAAWYVFRVINIAFIEPENPLVTEDNTTHFKPLAWLAMLLALSSLLLGFLGNPLMSLVTIEVAS